MGPGHAATSSTLAPAVAPPALADPYERATELILQGAVVVVGYDLSLGRGVSAALPIAVLLVPLWVGALRHYALAGLIAVLAVTCVPSGILLSRLAAQDHSISASAQEQMLGLLLSGTAAFVLIIWARQHLPLHRVVALYGLGGLLSALPDHNASWKYGLALPTTFLVLGLLEGQRRPVVTAGVVTALGVFGLVSDYRSFFAFCLLAAALTLWQVRPRAQHGASNRWMPAVLIAALGLGFYLLASTLLTAGYLGEEVQERTTKQIETSGSLIAGGRPEWAATFELMALKPSGYGVGVVPNLADLRVARAGLASINVDLQQERDRYMFGGEFRLHSIAADLWVRYGTLGVALAVTLLVGVVRGLSFSLAERRAATSVILAALLALWSLPFEPSHSYWLDVCVALGFVLVRRSTASGEAAAPFG